MEKFNELTIICGIEENDKEDLSQFRTGLRSEIQREITTLRPYVVDEAFRMGLKIEYQLKQPLTRGFDTQAMLSSS